MVKKPGAGVISKCLSSLTELLQVSQDAQVQGVNDLVGPKLPVLGRPKVVMVPSGPFQQRAPVLQ